MHPASSRVLLSVGAAVGMLIFLTTAGAAVWGLVSLMNLRTAHGNGGLASVSVGIGLVPLLLGAGGLIAFLLCARRLKALRKSAG
jgi:hypothetical protein